MSDSEAELPAPVSHVVGLRCQASTRTGQRGCAVICRVEPYWDQGGAAVWRRWPGVCGGLCRWTARPPHAGPQWLGTTDRAGSFAAQTVMLAVAAFLTPTRHPSVRL